MPTPAYTECLDAMYSMRRFGIILGLSTTANILAGLGNPQQTFSAIHIAGTNGKGSVASALATILQKAGYRVGLYTSPHLIRFNERICINGEPISDDAVVNSWEAVKSVHCGDREPTFFEFTTAMAFYEFGRHAVDWAVIETGMGGRMDSTNVIDPAISIITNISLEHKTYLGNTIKQITGEKAGIIKPGVPVITGTTQKVARTVIEAVANRQSAPLYIKGRDFRVRRSGNGRFSYAGIDHWWPGMKSGLMGNHQVDNAALVLAASELLMRREPNLLKDQIQFGLAQNRWPGRLEVVSEKPFVILDGAHNLMAARRLGRYLQDNLAGRRITMVAGILEDKPYEAILKDLVAPCARLIVTRAKIDRSLPPETLESVARPLVPDIQIVNDVAEAVRYAIATSAPEDAVCIAGSLYVVGEAKAELDKSGEALYPI
ncbi:bifunctional folylpolyglutamate synthase/dihydrofolate synthase [Desulfosarcina ovata subsp. sediminis]|uniref:Dihydrofolate synthase/folylpolyglutamate synthase n=1 Tax=Desulfosarcina ovata subsp. sediminis TaxID=885957 RepID=A0A5K8A2R2_9BACT|nr:folylpolyglutamate synthase/dihydrofolate synthase family protein [Desulfosarcina ovata]BBO86634.1 bifunctional folylpolyglutamate synthase/dihydrofolate synthase [Desulfosarcina ovata subsp. sediminis]